MTLALAALAAAASTVLAAVIVAARRRDTGALAIERANVVSASTDESVAAHESGHAILAWVSPFVTDVTVVVLNDDRESGVTRMTRGEIDSDARLWDAIAISLAGIAAEGYAFGRFRASSSEDDLAKARAWAERLVERDPEGRAPKFPWREPRSKSVIDVGAMFKERPSSAACAALNAAYRHAKTVIASRPERFDALRGALRERQILTERDVRALLGPRPWAIFAPRR